MTFNVPTLLLMIVLASGLMALAMVTVAWGERHEGLQFWAAGLGINALAYVFFGLRGAFAALAGMMAAELGLDEKLSLQDPGGWP